MTRLKGSFSGSKLAVLTILVRLNPNTVLLIIVDAGNVIVIVLLEMVQLSGVVPARSRQDEFELICKAGGIVMMRKLDG